MGQGVSYGNMRRMYGMQERKNGIATSHGAGVVRRVQWGLRPLGETSQTILVPLFPFFPFSHTPRRPLHFAPRLINTHPKLQTHLTSLPRTHHPPHHRIQRRAMFRARRLARLREREKLREGGRGDVGRRIYGGVSIVEQY